MGFNSRASQVGSKESIPLAQGPTRRLLTSWSLTDIAKRWLSVSLLLVSVVLIAIRLAGEHAGLFAQETITRKTVGNNTLFQHSPTIYGHVHMAKTAGTEINGELAVRYERVCGHKGYSYDAHKHNDRNEDWKFFFPDKALSETNGKSDSISRHSKGYNRGRVPLGIMQEIGYQDCDWVSLESPAIQWRQVVLDIHPLPLEVHIPCREPIDYLLSMCNYMQATFHCNVTDSQLHDEIGKCIFQMNRFNDEQLWALGVQALKCFNPIPIESYLEYMGPKLQEKRIVREYVHRNTNGARHKDAECLQTEMAVREKVKKILVQRWPIFGFCDRCLGSKDDLLA